MRAQGAAGDATQRAEQALARGEIDAAVAHLSTAVREYATDGDVAGEAMASVRLGLAMANGLSNRAASRAWFARARRLLADLPPCIEQGWAAVAEMGCDVDDPADLLAAAELALDRARRFGDVNLEVKALADAGLAHVQAGRIEQGMSLLDEAMAVACGPADDTGAACRAVCSFFTACYYAADFERAATWATTLRRCGLLGTSGFGPLFISSHCDTVQAAALVEIGRWAEAEALLVESRERFAQGLGIPAWHPDLGLADLRIRQGRLAEAEVLLLGKEQYPDALLPWARLHLARGDAELALIAAHRGLRALGDDCLRAADLLTTVVAAELRTGDVGAARRATDQLVGRVGSQPVGPLRARVTLTQARVVAAEGDAGAAIELLSAAADSLAGSELHYLRALLLTELAGLLAGTDRQREAASAARAASVVLAATDAVLPSSAGAVDQTGSGPATAALTEHSRGWSATHGAMTVQLTSSKGLRYLAELIATPGHEHHALDLVDRVEGLGAVDRRALGDTGPALDAQARRAYRRRIEELRAEIDEALAGERWSAAERAQGEADQVVAQLAQAFGLSGRGRPTGSVTEKARLNVTRALRTAVTRLAGGLPEAAAALDRDLRTGSYCCYTPGDATLWIVHREVNGTGGW